MEVHVLFERNLALEGAFNYFSKESVLKSLEVPLLSTFLLQPLEMYAAPGA